MRFLCPSCRGIVEADDLQAGEEVQCGHCDEVVRVPAGKFAPGSIIGDFCIEREIAKGGMGVVYRSRQISLDRIAALKILQPHLVNDPALVSGLIQEARAAAKLNHPNIVQAYAVGEDGGVFYFAMEFVDGPTMKSVLKKEQIIQPRRSAEIIREIADALQCAWDEQKLTHRDLKPDNIILASNGRAKLADLGLSHVGNASEPETETTEVLGTPQYISPEQLTGAPIDTRSDLYSLGATFFQFVTGRFPYVGKTAEEIVRQHVEGILTPPKEINKMLPDELNRIIVKLMQKNPADRYQKPSELIKDLDAFLAGKAPAGAPRGLAAGQGGAGALSSGTGNVPTPHLQAASAAASVNILPPGGGVKINFRKEAAKPQTPPQPAAPAEKAAGDAAPPPAAAAPAAAAPAPASGGGAGRTPAKPVRSTGPLLKKAAPPPPPEAPAEAKVEVAPPRPGMTEAQKQKIKLYVAVGLLLVAGVVAFFHFDGMSYVNQLLGRKEDAGSAAPAQPESGGAAAVTTPAAGQTTETAPPPPPPPTKVTSNYLEEGRRLLSERSTVSDEVFLQRCDLFFAQFPAPSTPEELELMRRIAPVYAELEERLRAPQARRQLAEELRTQIAARRESAEAARRAAEDAQRAAEEARAAANALDAQRRSESEQYLAKLRQEREVLFLAFVRSVVTNDRSYWQQAEAKKYLLALPPQQVHADVRAAVQAEFDTVRQMSEQLDSTLEQLRHASELTPRILGSQWEDEKRNLYALTGFSAAKLTFQSPLNDSILEINPAEMPAEQLKQLNARIDKRTGMENALFFALLARREVAPWMAAIAPAGYWQNNFQALLAAQK